ncbi:MAG: hypothetical protein RL497_1860, partial [Pseudomonadota bacterium]
IPATEEPSKDSEAPAADKTAAPPPAKGINQSGVK